MIIKGPGSVNGAPRLLLRAEGLGVALASVAAFAWSGASWLLFAALILAPDLSMLGYLAGPRRGAAVYNAIHTYLGPVVLFGGAAALAAPTRRARRSRSSGARISALIARSAMA